MWLINWLVEQYERLYKLLVDWYNEVRQYAEYGFGQFRAWVKGWIDYVLSWASQKINEARAIIDGVRSWLLAEIQRARDAANALFNDAVSFAVRTINDGLAWAAATINNTRDWLIEQINNGIGWAVAQINAVLDWTSAAIGNVRQYAETRIEEVRRALSNLVNQGIAAALAEAVKVAARLAAFVSTWEARLTGFFDDPGRFIWNYIEANAYAWAEYFLALLLKADTQADPSRPASIGGAVASASMGALSSPGESVGLHWPTSSALLVAPAWTPEHPVAYVQAEPGAPLVSPGAGVITAAGFFDPARGGEVEIVLDAGHVSAIYGMDTVNVFAPSRIAAGGLLGTAGISGALPAPGYAVSLWDGQQWANPSDVFIK